MYYFAYGNNMNPDMIKEQGVEYFDRRKGIIRGYRIIFNKKAKDEEYSFANIEQTGNDEDIIEGILYELDNCEMKEIDRKEGFPTQYNKYRINVETDDGTVQAFVYIAQPEWINNNLKPPKFYINNMLKGKDLISPNYLNFIENVETYEE
ncbi:MAG: gamma-glutamylcyclotransferase family protein [Thermotogota bacterium]